MEYAPGAGRGPQPPMFEARFRAFVEQSLAEWQREESKAVSW